MFVEVRDSARAAFEAFLDSIDYTTVATLRRYSALENFMVSPRTMTPVG